MTPFNLAAYTAVAFLLVAGAAGMGTVITFLPSRVVIGPVGVAGGCLARS